MSRIIRPVVSPTGRVIVLSGATLWLAVAMVLSATPSGAGPTDVLGTTVQVASFETVQGVDGLLYYPRVFTDAHGNVYVSDEASARIVRLAGDLAAPTAAVVFGGKGQGPGEMELPHSVAVDSRGNVFATDMRLGRINKYAPDGNFITSVVLPFVASVVIDSQDRVIAYPGRGEALLSRFDNDLGGEERLLAKTDQLAHFKALGVLLAMGPGDRLYLLDQTGPRLDVYDPDFNRIESWDVDAPALRETIAHTLAAARARIPGSTPRVFGIQSMALSADGSRLLFAYLIRPSAKEFFTRVAAYSAHGDPQGYEDRDTSIYATAFMPDGRWLEGDPEAVTVRGLQPTSSDD